MIWPARYCERGDTLLYRLDQTASEVSGALKLRIPSESSAVMAGANANVIFFATPATQYADHCADNPRSGFLAEFAQCVRVIPVVSSLP